MTNGGYMDPSALNTCVAQAVVEGWNAGVMAFQGRLHVVLLRHTNEAYAELYHSSRTLIQLGYRR